MTGVYALGDVEEKVERIKDWIEMGEKEKKVIIKGDLNARMGELGTRTWGVDEVEPVEKRRSKDKKVNAEGKKLLKVTEETGWFILNGNIEGEEEGECTENAYAGARGESVIDYVLTDEGGKEGTERMEVRERVDSDHFPLIVSIRGKGELEGKSKRKEK